jgi:hypothetical protein
LPSAHPVFPEIIIYRDLARAPLNKENVNPSTLDGKERGELNETTAV